jgi:hypothetical protein
MLDQGVVLEEGEEKAELINHLHFVEVFDQGVGCVRVCSNTLQMFFFLFCFISIHKDN